MKSFIVIGKFTTTHYQSQVFDASSKEEARKLAVKELSINRYEYLEWQVEDIKDNQNFEIVEIKEFDLS